ADSANTEVTVTYTKQAAAEVSETKEVTRTINYVYADGSQASEPVVETKTFTRIGAKDAVTDAITWNAWSQAQEFGAVTSPVIKGYTADKAEVATQSVTADSANIEVTVTYTKQAAAEVSETKEVTRTINYVYADGLQALAPVVETKTFTRTGTKDAVTDAITWGAWSSAQEFASVMSPQISGYWADRTSVPATTVDHMSPDQVERVVYTANYSLTERFVDNMGNELIPSIVKKNLFVPGMDFDNTADAKVITGYVLQKIENGIGTFGEGDETTTFIYAKVGNIVPVDENGNALVPPVPYENDKDDPFGVTPHQKVPTIPGYKAEVEFVDPTDPTSDTIVKYVAEKTAEVPEVSEKQEPTKTKGVTVPTSQVGPKATTPVTDEAKVAELPQMGDDAKAQVTGVGAMLVALAGILGLGVKNKRKED
ncbi:MucBP domain-containing protein, partial [Lactobacillus murinus]|uniref:mucin-binding protein n=1 Tax=Ligilactobacillus murinus TaxID=1622 RepID=UPI001883E839